MKLRQYDLLTRMLRTRPILVASVFYIVGCCAARILSLPISVPVTFAVICLAAAIPFRRARALLLVLCVLASGAANFTLRWQHSHPIASQNDVALSGRICDAPYYNARTDRLLLTLDDVVLDGRAVEGRLRLYLRNDEDPAALMLDLPSIGTVVSCTAHAWEPSGATNIGQFDYAAYLRVNGFCGYATAKLESLSRDAYRPYFSDFPARIRQTLSARIDLLFPNRSDIAAAFILGDRSDISEEDKNAFAAAGIAHILAISGMHVSLLSYLLMRLLNRKLSRTLSFAVVFTLLLAYAWILGFPPAMFRAFFMFFVAGVGTIVGRHTDPLTSLALSALVYLLIFPLQILSTSFALSYSATLGIILLLPPLNALFRAERFARVSSDLSALRRCLRLFTRRIVELFMLTLAAQMAILPLVIDTYGSQSLLSFPAGLIAVPTAVAGYILSIPAVLLNLRPLAAVADALFSLLTWIARAAASLPVTALRMARFPVPIMLFWVVVCFAASNLSRIRLSVRRFLPLLLIPAILVSDLCAHMTARGTSVVFLDAGQADCAVIRADGKIYLVDTGDAYSPVADYLSAMNYPVDGVFLTHPHADHIGGLEDILALTTPARIFISRNWYDFPIDESVSGSLEACRLAGSEIVTVSSGDIVDISDRASIRVLFPQAGILASSANDDSLMLLLECGDSSVLFTGDASADTIAPYALDADILKVPHHGANGSLSETFLEKVSPSACVISVGYNTYGHPTASSLDLIDLARAECFRTDLSGAVTCRLDPSGSIAITTYK